MTAPQPLTASEFKSALLDVVPHLRAFARSLCNDAVAADDLVQDTMLRAWKARDSFTPTTSFRAWTFTILRNVFYSEKRRSWRSTELSPEMAERTLVASDDPSKGLELVELRNALDHLPDDQREAVILVGAGGMAYEEAAQIIGCAVGTIKSRVSRGRKALCEMLDGNKAPQPLRGGPVISSGSEAFNDIMEQVSALSREGG